MTHRQLVAVSYEGKRGSLTRIDPTGWVWDRALNSSRSGNVHDGDDALGRPPTSHAALPPIGITPIPGVGTRTLDPLGLARPNAARRVVGAHI